MKEPIEPDAERLRTVVRDARPTADLPPGFQNAVWRRIEHAQAQAQSPASWLEQMVALLLRPRWAFAGIAALLLLGIGIGFAQGASLANDQARQQYLTAVSPFILR